MRLEDKQASEIKGTVLCGMTLRLYYGRCLRNRKKARRKKHSESDGCEGLDGNTTAGKTLLFPLSPPGRSFSLFSFSISFLSLSLSFSLLLSLSLFTFLFFNLVCFLFLSPSRSLSLSLSLFLLFVFFFFLFVSFCSSHSFCFSSSSSFSSLPRCTG